MAQTALTARMPRGKVRTNLYLSEGVADALEKRVAEVSAIIAPHRTSVSRIAEALIERSLAATTASDLR